jgi:hypothetical protein
MTKSLNDILKRYSDALSGKRESKVSALTTGDNPGVDYADKMKDGRDFIAQHSVEKHEDRVGNGDDVYNASKVQKAKMERHGHEPKPKDIKVYKKNQQVGEETDSFKSGTRSPVEGSIEEAKDVREYGYEGDMAITQLKTICRNSEHLMKMLKPDTDLPEWVQSKITKAEDYISTAHDYLMSEMNEETEQLDEAKCNMTEAGKMCEVHGSKACPKEGTDSASDKEEPRFNGVDKPGKRKLLTDKKIQEMAVSQNQAISARIALKNKKEGTTPPKGTASSSMMNMTLKQLRDYTHAEKGAPKKVEEGLSDQRSSSPTASEKAREKFSDAIEKRKQIKMKEQSAPAETPITMPSGAVGDTGRV